jgi:hypothetical protein
MMLFGFGVGKWLKLYGCSSHESFRLHTNGKVVRPYPIETLCLVGAAIFRRLGPIHQPADVLHTHVDDMIDTASGSHRMHCALAF